MIKVEPNRIEAMTLNIMTKALPQLMTPEGGTILIIVGHAHVKNLAASLKVKIADYPDCDIDIQPMTLSLPADVADISILESDKSMRLKGSPALDNAYDQLDHKVFFCTHTSSDYDFEKIIEVFKQAFNFHKQTSAQPSTHTEEKKQPNPSALFTVQVPENIKILFSKYGIKNINIPSQNDVEKLLRTIVANAKKVSEEQWKKDLTTLLSSTKVNINAQDKNGKTALHIAVEKDNPDVIQFLLNNNADSIEDNSHKLPRDYTAKEDILKLFQLKKPGQESRKTL